MLDVYADLFQEPKSLPPPRQFDRHIQLVPGAQPINVRPYRYSPSQKSEIEHQLPDMLVHGHLVSCGEMEAISSESRIFY